MKKILKGFTLIELIIVMAILTILMTAILQMFKPIRETYVDSTLYESQRTAQNGIIEYISESLRYATDLGIYATSDTQGPASNMADAVDKFADAYCKKNPSAVKANIVANAEVIMIDNTANAYEFNGKDCTGRLLRRNNVGTATVSELNTRLVLGDAYYGENNYSIKVSKPPEIMPHTGATLTSQEQAENNAENLDWSADEGIRITVASTVSYGNRQLQKDLGTANNITFNSQLIHTDGLVVCPNLSKAGGLFDVQSDTDRDDVADALAAGDDDDDDDDDGGGGGESPPADSGIGSSNNDAFSRPNGYKTDDTVVDPSPGGGGGGGGGGGPAPASDSSSYDSSNANAAGTKVYIVFLTQ